MIGFYDYTVVLTYLGALLGLLSMIFSGSSNFMAAIFCLAGCLVCDTLDGPIARGKKGRTDDEMRFGIQIDSLCDLVSFGIAPAAFFFHVGLRTIPDLLLLGFYCLCCIIRLAYFNVLAGNAELGTKGDYHGLPVVCLAILVPALYMTGLWLPEGLFLWVMRLGVGFFGLHYILDFKVKKPVLWKFIAMIAVFWVPVGILLLKG